MATPKAALITGASSGIGLSIAEMLLGEGFAVTIAGRRPDKLAAAESQLSAGGRRVFAISGRIGAEDGIEQRLVAAHIEAHGRLDVLVNNAGLATEHPLEEMDQSRIDLQIAVNLKSVLAFYRAALPALRKAAGDDGSAWVINTSSVSAHSPRAGLSVYGATKAAVSTLTRAMNAEVGHEGIKSCALSPGYVDTPMTEHVASVQRGDMIQPGDLAVMVRGLLGLSRACVIPEIVFQRQGGVDW